MAIFANAAAFDDPKSHLLAMGVDLNTEHAIVDTRGNVLAYKETGGIINPSRYELWPDTKIFRFGGGGRSPDVVAQGNWWIEQREFEKLFSFAQAQELAIGMAMRCLCLVPPEWSDMSLLIRARVSRALLAWRGLGNSVITPAATFGGNVWMLHQNDIAARQLGQLFVPGLNQSGITFSAISIENYYELDPGESVRGFIYL
jgi:hypothetical protein